MDRGPVLRNKDMAKFMYSVFFKGGHLGLCFDGGMVSKSSVFGAEEMTQPVKCLPCKYEDMCPVSIASNAHKKPAMVACAC